MARRSLDEKDLMILALLRQNARISTVELAKRVGLAPTPCRARIQKLESSGQILGYTIEEDIAKDGHAIKFMLIEAANTHKDTIRRIEMHLKRHLAVSSIWSIEGKYDYLVMIEENDIDLSRDIIRDLRALGVAVDILTASVVDHVFRREKVSLR